MDGRLRFVELADSAAAGASSGSVVAAVLQALSGRRPNRARRRSSARTRRGGDRRSRSPPRSSAASGSTGEATGAVRAGGRLLTLLTPRDRIGPVRLAVIGADGTVRTVALPGITAGSTPSGEARRSGEVRRRLELAAGRLARGRAGPGAPCSRSISTRLAVRTQRLDMRSTARATKLDRRLGPRSASGCSDNTIAYSGWSLRRRGGSRPTIEASALVDVATPASADARREGGVGDTRAGRTLLVHGGRPAAGLRGSTGRLASSCSRARTPATSRSPDATRTSAAATAPASRSSTSPAGRSRRLARTAKPTAVLAALDSPA